ncbi:predicted protein [Nematostella vectensis]|uniref:Polyadenylate-binding protein-interacting protein 1 n=1 Tax=Nematostella vectensis TaxID=45351 RepID=A7RXB2_NEMVE|nr:predicted protein [Nematostella vectensis]|eukprot:XP_001635997.1 predicted protein [Nematostella vectensis]
MSDKPHSLGRGISSKDYTSPLRKPGEPSQNQDGGKEPIGIENDSIPTKGTSSKLNVNAAEFVPEMFKAPQYVPTSQAMPPPQTEQATPSPQTTGPDLEAVTFVKDILDQLTESPGEFENLVEDLVLAWKARVNNDETLNEIASVIMEQVLVYSILESNFTYTGARLCDFIANNTDDIPTEGKQFRSVFLTRCKEEHRKREAMLKSPSTVPRHRCNTLLAGKEVDGASGSKAQFGPLGRALLEMLDSLIESGTDDSLLYAGRILKLTGYLLDDPKDNQSRVDGIFEKIGTLLESSSHVGDSIKRFLSSVVSLRKNNWGRESFAERGAEAAAVSVATSVLSPEAAPYVPGIQNYHYYNKEYYQPGFISNNEDDITPVTNPEQWLEYADYADDSSPTDLSYPVYEDNGHGYREEDDCAFTEEMEKDYELFMSEQQPPLPFS